ncbi:PREDICTED: type-1 angiotensin II receptor-like [Nanorana parkeri]|uniref:type-1 angiotensin II receptor-like n=1 Tax=Nanorana parkeri TaxID=125878 RepID=UPI0008549AFC|nr:PREDICTED: type-1 angiotensin II receptor-like [Nanorana parkeri]
MDFQLSNLSSVSIGYIPLRVSSDTGSTNCSALGYDASYQFVLIPIIYMILFVVGIVGNTVIIVGLTCCIQAKSVANIYIVNLAIADLSFVATLPFWAIDMSVKYKWVFGSCMCKLCATLSSVNMYASIFFLTCLGADRYYSIVHPIEAHGKRTLTKAKMIILFVWLSSIAVSTPTIFFRQTYYSSYSHQIVCAMKYPPNSLFWHIFVYSVKFILGFFIPFIIQGICYVLIYKKILASAKAKRKKTKSDNVLRAVVAMVLAFFICWLPFHIVNLLKLLARFKLITSCMTIHNINVVIPITVCIAYSNSCINPILYYFASKRFRNQLIKSLKRSL